ncbi:MULTISPECIES: hypothetical protein [unclassified Campylobacter]|uniref:hypothetical protein n=1 Tax=unclassified Campylobacter TaxID=2593542 RepID=UPI001E0F3D9C|nr:hypothetical protein [Campylobacter sp. RM12651]MBZ7978506.1 hypothetical protein [Campylobacter sp. RM12654]MBZ7980906.1 hypothetical protein [Campylobacter sp. RM12642]MBZ7990583.1 hypothetical protein [Campylobacter sp. RM9331]MBZ8004778.1 hypothetical protein [Campylobacter sp. RM9332]MBZ8007106.1 hypothetical protein [Campylobacter sp. RM9334]
MKEENNKLTPLHKANISDIKKKLPKLKQALKNEIETYNEEMRFKIFDEIKEVIIIALQCGKTYKEIIELLKNNLEVMVTDKQLARYVKEVLKLKRIGTQGGKLANIDSDGNFINYVDIENINIDLLDDN